MKLPTKCGEVRTRGIGQYGIRINDQHRSCIRWENGEAQDVEIKVAIERKSRPLGRPQA
jgi:hypothetical protein